jgi:hypothetical protein
MTENTFGPVVLPIDERQNLVGHHTTVGALFEGDTGVVVAGQFAGRAFAVRHQGGTGRTMWVDWATGTDGVVRASTPCERIAPAEFCAARGHAVRTVDNREQDTCPRCGASLVVDESLEWDHASAARRDYLLREMNDSRRS